MAPVDGTFDVEKGKCKKIRFTFSANKYTLKQVVIENLGFSAGNYLTWCGLFITKVGYNLPCLNPRSLHWIYCVPHNNFVCEKQNEHNETEFWASIGTGNIHTIHEEYSMNPFCNLY